MTTSLLDLGWYQRPDGRRALLTWWSHGAVTLDGPGGIEILGFIPTEDQARQVFDGWADDDHRPVTWVHARMAAAVADGTAACPDCAGTGRRTFPDPFQDGSTLEAACPTCTAVKP